MPSLVQPTLFDFFSPRDFPVSQNAATAIEELANNNNSKRRGAVYTRPEVVDFILDLIGYNSETPLFQKRILEPSFGNGEFLLSIVDRVVASWKRCSTSADSKELKDSLLAVELH
ncbi:MAG: SAM-dependent DNA methyltransferase, partial [Candidatus Electrothrix sp. ATG2]|nr:SAM-dependent DNA methyltransferase [Candidatus Electrothrix sp. ATG2]